jgi:hypothetical protein
MEEEDDDCNDDDDADDDADADYDEEEEEEEEMERSVLLFNTWSNDSGPGISRNDSDDTSKGCGEGSAVEEELEVEHVEHILCNPISLWRQQAVNLNANVPQSTTDETASSKQQEQVVRVSLMGEQNRRGVPESTVRLTTHSNHSLRAALEEERKVTMTRLYPTQY